MTRRKRRKQRNFYEDLLTCISEMGGGILLKFGMWPPLKLFPLLPSFIT